MERTEWSRDVPVSLPGLSWAASCFHIVSIFKSDSNNVAANIENSSDSKRPNELKIIGRSQHIFPISRRRSNFELSYKSFESRIQIRNPYSIDTNIQLNFELLLISNFEFFTSLSLATILNDYQTNVAIFTNSQLSFTEFR